MKHQLTYTTLDFALAFGVSDRTIRKACREGRLKAKLEKRTWIIFGNEMAKVQKSGGWKKYLIDCPK